LNSLDSFAGNPITLFSFIQKYTKLIYNNCFDAFFIFNVSLGVLIVVNQLPFSHPRAEDDRIQVIFFSFFLSSKEFEKKERKERET
jgi:hypothetical protein